MIFVSPIDEGRCLGHILKLQYTPESLLRYVRRHRLQTSVFWVKVVPSECAVPPAPGGPGTDERCVRRGFPTTPPNDHRPNETSLGPSSHSTLDDTGNTRSESLVCDSEGVVKSPVPRRVKYLVPRLVPLYPPPGLAPTTPTQRVGESSTFYSCRRGRSSAPILLIFFITYVY